MNQNQSSAMNWNFPADDKLKTVSLKEETRRFPFYSSYSRATRQTHQNYTLYTNEVAFA
jgi:hypothetical protein